jgi:hypothetical protein
MSTLFPKFSEERKEKKPKKGRKIRKAKCRNIPTMEITASGETLETSLTQFGTFL